MFDGNEREKWYESGVLIICLMKFYWKKSQLISLKSKVLQQD